MTSKLAFPKISYWKRNCTLQFIIIFLFIQSICTVMNSKAYYNASLQNSVSTWQFQSKKSNCLFHSPYSAIQRLFALTELKSHLKHHYFNSTEKLEREKKYIWNAMKELRRSLSAPSFYIVLKECKMPKNKVQKNKVY